MSDASTPPPDETGEALARLASHGRDRNKRRRGSAGAIVTLGVLVALVAAGWATWQQMELQREVAALRADNEALRQQAPDTSAITAIQQRQQALDNALQQRDAELDAAIEQRAQQLEAALRATQQQVLRQTQESVAESSVAATAQAERLAVVERNLTALRRDLGRRETDGVPLAEAELLLRFAQQRLLVAHDTQGAIALYRQADTILRGVDDAALFAVRDALARELAALEAVPVVDVSGLFARLGALSARVGDFNVVVEGAVQDFTVQPPVTPDATAQAWWDSVKQTLSRYFVITQSTADITPQLGSSEQFLLRTLVQLHIEQARLALLNDQPQLYRTALDDAASVAQRWLRGENGSLDDFISALEELRDTAIVSDPPQVGDALAALQQVAGAPQ